MIQAIKELEELRNITNSQLYFSFKEITGFKKVYSYQIRVAEALQNGEVSDFTGPPTGSGKTEAVIIPFLIGMNECLPSQMVYSLPS